MSRRRAVGSSRWHPFLRPCCRGLVGGPIFLGLLRWALIGLEDDHLAIRGPWARATFDRSSTKRRSARTHAVWEVVAVAVDEAPAPVASKPPQNPHYPPGSAAQVAHSPRNLGGDLRKRRTARTYGVYLGTGIRAGQRPVSRSSGSAAGRLKVAPYTMTPGIIGRSGGMPSDHAACGDAGQRAGPLLRSDVFGPPGPGAEQASDLHGCETLDTRALVT